MTTSVVSNNTSINNPNPMESEGDQELLENVLQDIAKQTNNEKKLFNQTHELKFSNLSDDESEYAKISSNHKSIDQSSYPENPEVVYTTYQPTPMEVLKQSFKWSAIVALIVFLFSQPQIINKIAAYLPSKLLSENLTLNTYGSIFIALLAGLIYFVLFQWVL